MGLLSTTNHFHEHTSSPSSIDVTITEKRAPTDESVKLLKEMQESVLKSVIGQIKVDDNVVTGEAIAFDLPWLVNDIKVVYKFKINGIEYCVEKEISKFDFNYENGKDYERFRISVIDYIKSESASVIAFFTLKTFAVVAFEKIYKKELPEEFKNKYVKSK